MTFRCAFQHLYMLYSHEQLYIHICMQNHNDDTIKTSEDTSLEKYTSHFMRKGSKGLLKVLLWEGVGEGTELQHIDPHSYGHNSVSFPFSWSAQAGAWGPTLLGAGFLYRTLSPTNWYSCAPSYIIVRLPPSSCGRHKLHSFKPSKVKVIFRYSSTGFTFYLHRCISYFDSPAGSEVNIQHIQIYSRDERPQNLNDKSVFLSVKKNP